MLATVIHAARDIRVETVPDPVLSTGADAIVRVGAAGLLWSAHVTRSAVRDLDLAPGVRVWIAVKTRAFRRLH